ncbi:DUF3606 domain-containing protein [Mesorhizobium sp. AR02]|nr:DUF3606 domain-containing protein [Mesorhizobium sp. AR02]
MVLLHGETHADGRLFHRLEPCTSNARSSDWYAGGERRSGCQKTSDTSRVVKGQELEVQHLTETTDLSPNQARALLRKHGNDWAKIKDEAENYKAES